MTIEGMGVMINRLFGYGSVDPQRYYGRRIQAASLNNDEVRLDFDDGSALKLTDEGQSCCEKRYMLTADNVTDLVGKTLTEISLRDGGFAESEYGGGDTHEIMFLHINAEDVSVVVSTHNEHNGYYGGFSLFCREVEQ